MIQFRETNLKQSDKIMHYYLEWIFNVQIVSSSSVLILTTNRGQRWKSSGLLKAIQRGLWLKLNWNTSCLRSDMLPIIVSSIWSGHVLLFKIPTYTLKLVDEIQSLRGRGLLALGLWSSLKIFFLKLNFIRPLNFSACKTYSVSCPIFACLSQLKPARSVADQSENVDM